ncbi:hypothetical protein [Methylobacter sp.]
MTSTGKKSARDTLFDYVKNPVTLFYWYHNPRRIYDLNREKKNWDEKWLEKNLCEIRKDPQLKKEIVIHKHLNAFFEATLDEVRLKKANCFSEFALWISGNVTLAYFREAASKREVTADIDYDMQRDHAVHTLYNYILGWYIFEKSGDLREEFNKRLGCPKMSDDEIDFYKTRFYGEVKDTELIVQANEFGDVWAITSLLHDIGYILEGTISSASTEVENTRVSRGSKVVHDYFNHRFWENFKVDFRSAQHIAKLFNISVPDFRFSRSLASLGDHLCDIGSCENIRRKLKECRESKTPSNAAIMEDYGLNREAFSIWNMYYEFYDQLKMQAILDTVKNEYYDAVWKGSNQGYRNLNHGVCSGLIVLQALTFCHEFVWGFNLNNWTGFNNEQKEKGRNLINCISEQIYAQTQSQVTRQFVPEEMAIRGAFSAEAWFKKVLWSTASIAIHDFMQEGYYKKICVNYGIKDGYEKISFKEDPLAFLGILVDALEEWDRYTISGKFAFSEKAELLQSTEVYIDPYTGSDRVNFYYPRKKLNEEKDFRADIDKVLRQCLDGWQSVVNVLDLDVNQL